MTAPLVFVIVVGAVIGYANGANDLSKGIATLVGSGVTDFRRASLWAATWTALGGLTGGVTAHAMVTAFGHGLLADGVATTFAAAAATLVGAAIWVLLATRFGLPVSTTHAIIGSLGGVALCAYGAAGVRWGVLGTKLALPLLVSPMAALAITLVLLRVARRLAPAADECCVCAVIEEAAPVATAVAPGLSIATSLSPPSLPVLAVVAGDLESCDRNPAVAARLDLDKLHWLSAGATSFARGMNDAPKMAALILAAGLLVGDGGRLSTRWVFFEIALSMAAGGLIAGARVTRVLGNDITRLDHRSGLVANLVTSVLVGVGAVLGWPMSTTHVSTAAVIGTGVEQGGGNLRRKTVRDMALAWLVTAPLAGAIGVAVYGVARAIAG